MIISFVDIKLYRQNQLLMITLRWYQNVHRVLKGRVQILHHGYRTSHCYEKGVQRDKAEQCGRAQCCYFRSRPDGPNIPPGVRRQCTHRRLH
ncbi:hypothetical protein ATCV1_z141R [Acanthocystis turfacea chlorella virus 1]|uniref:Uncharacterized protein z141R n=1 Tax=Chlorovirus heliozoae TaxID=322019 RepID=A7K8A1_9PHYC|nr:hypothetical protein ATCV1_z141R [Acanthocystis turfacea chlorella virus 1]ABT16275.1 hypothetical protein ATCV1_z141R [Acanthocystis turfacea chlorella virus 1]